MDPNRFDRFSRSLGHRLNRRQALGSLAVAGAALGAPTAVAGAQGGECMVTLTATVRMGPNASTLFTSAGETLGEFSGVLTLPPDGSTEAQITVETGTTQAAIVERDGHALNIRLDVVLGGAFILSGMASAPIEECNGAVDGLFTGPAPGDIGDWHGVFAGVGGISAPTGSSEGASTSQAPTAPTLPPTETCSEIGGPCQARGDCCTGLECEVATATCRCLAIGEACAPGGSLICCDNLRCLAPPGETQMSCCLDDGAACTYGRGCCGGYCVGGLCTSTAPPPPQPCGQVGGPCNNEGVCCGNAYCDLQDPPGTCICATQGAPCIPVGTGACCDGQPCTGEGVCP